MHDFVYVDPEEVKAVRDELYEIIHEVQNIVRDNFTFQFKSVGSYKQNMITYDRKSNIGFDFDFDLEVNDDEENFSPKEIRQIIQNAMDRIVPRYGYKCCGDSTRVLTIKKINTYTSRILHSCDFALVHNCGNGRQQYIRFNKKNSNYTWEFQGNGFKNLEKKIKWLRDHKHWGELRDYYIKKKNNNDDPDKHSRSILAESVNEMCQKKKCKIK